ncbi:ATP-binding protein [Flavobacterium sp. UMI-01]|uniref:ATP-binding protein n=1 Tax=Flavobacterium sp. UMI-01 TaxID=1441053 RepID=UPI001C7CA21E|nr:transporter substrate-binding domain-containing protein [Flavobacterium sp. UMI-01]GIZ07572.1 hypothetical protein FUMI01_02990 [Flavobacterium sp. UMI-01]
MSFLKLHINKLLLLLIIVLNFIPSPIYSQNTNTRILKVGVYDSPPKIFLNDNKEPEGIFIDILKDIGTNENLVFEYHYDSWANLLNKLENGKIDILPGTTYDVERNTIFKFNKIEILNSWVEIFSRKSLELKTLSDLKNKKIGVIKGSLQEKYIVKILHKDSIFDFQIVPFNTYIDFVGALKKGKIDVILTDRFFAFSKLYDKNINRSGIIINSSTLHFAFKKNEKKELIDLFDKNISDLKNDSDSVYYKTLFHWLDRNIKPSIPNYIKWLIVAFIASLVIALFFVLLLRKSVKNKTKELSIAKEKAEEREEQLKSIANNFSNGMIYQITMTDENNRKFNYVSDTVLKFYDCTVEEAKKDANLLYNKIHPEDINVLIEKEKEALKNMTVFNAEVRVINPNGTIRWSYYTSKPRIINNVICWDGIEIDISERKLMEIELQKSKEKAEESDRLKTAFLTNLSHEIRTPMNGILGFSKLLQEPNLEGELQKKYFEIIQKSGERMLNIINDIINISKIEAGLMEIHLQPTNINQKVEFVYNFFKPIAQNASIELILKNSLETKEIHIHTDREKLLAIITNLVNNAIKHTEKGKVEISCYKKNNFIEFSVKDTGIGIARDRHDAIFKRFIQADLKNKKAIQGAGLGLSISKAYVEMLGGNIWVESELGKGSIFYFTIPFHTVITNEPAEMTLTSTPNKTLTNKLKILIAEDDKMSELLLTKLVKEFSREIIKARNGKEAVEAMYKHPDIDLIMMDIQMPEMNGHEATREIRKFNQNTIIIAQTAYALIGDKERIIESGCNDCITKPINSNELKSLIFKYFN